MGSRVAPLLIVIFVAAGLAVHWEHGPILGADDHGQYLLHARNLVEGRPYADVGFLHSKHTTLIAPIAEPPALPYAIAFLFKVTGGESLVPVRLLIAVLLGLFGWFAYRVFLPMDGPAIAITAAICSVVPIVRAHSLDMALADVPFCAAIWLVFLLSARRSEDEPLTPLRIAALALGGALAFSFRMAALPLLPAGAMMVLFLPRREKAGWLVVTAIWTGVAYLVMFGQAGASALGGESLGRTPAAMLHDLWQNAWAIFTGLGEVVPFSTPWPRVTQVIRGVVLLAALLGIGFTLRGKRLAQVPFLVWGALCTLAMLAALPVQDTRYLWVLLPFFAAGALRVAGIINPARNRESPLPGQWLIAAPILLMCAVHLMNSPTPRNLSFAGNMSLKQAIAALKKDIQPGESPRVAIFSPRVFTWETRIPATGFYKATANETFEDLRAKKITHIVSGDDGLDEKRAVHFQNLINYHPEFFPVVFVGKKFSVYRVNLAEPPPQRAELATSPASGASAK